VNALSLFWIVANILVIIAIPKMVAKKPEDEKDFLRSRLIGLWLATNGILGLAYGYTPIIQGNRFWVLFGVFLAVITLLGLRRFLAPTRREPPLER
jgi:low temperature requirement protein LtrA